jgi:predicted amidohydrolase
MSKSKTWIAAAAQMTSEKGQEVENLRKVLEAVDKASGRGAEVIAFPEAMNNGYIFESPEEAHAMATTIPGRFTAALCKKAEEKQIHIGIGILEKAPDGRSIYNNSLLFSPEGRIIGQYRKNFFIKADKHWLRQGDIGYPTFRTDAGTFGFFICADGRIPEPARCTAVNGAQVFLNTSNWGGPDQYLVHVPTRAVENRCWVIGVTKIGEEPGNYYTGNSFIMDPHGNRLAQAGGDQEEIIYAEIAPSTADDKSEGMGNDLFKDRRPELYSVLVSPFEETPLFQALAEKIHPDTMNVQLGAVQTSYNGSSQSTLDQALKECREAHHKYNVEVMVLPEMFLFDREEVAKNPSAAASFSMNALKHFVDLAKETRTYCLVNLVEMEGPRCFSTAYFVSPTGILGKYRKTHLWGMEKVWAKPGESFEVIRTPFGNLGIMLGYEGRFPEIARCLALMGADAILWPCDWQRELEFKFIAPERALENRLFIVAANRLDSPAEGPSLLVMPLGYPITTLTVERPHGKKGFVSRLLNLTHARSKRIHQNTDLFRDRRPDLYRPLVETCPVVI